MRRFVLHGLGLMCAMAFTSVHSSTNNQAVHYSDQNNSNVSGYELSDTKQKPWEQWHLTEQDWIKYQQHMRGPRGVWSPELDPLTVLGVEASSEQEREMYARKLAMIEFERAEKELAFQRSYDKAMKTLYPNTPMIDVSKLPDEKKYKSNSLKLSALNIKGERLLYFTKADKCDACDQTIQRLIDNWVNYGGSMDIYVIGAKTDNAIRDWAKRVGIDPKWVKAKQITLNHEKGMLFVASNGMKNAPWISVRRNNKYASVQ